MNEINFVNLQSSMKDYLQRQIWLLSQLYENPRGLTREQLSERWKNSSLNSLGTTLPPRTFSDSIRSIESAFFIDISCNAHDGYRYKIENRATIDHDRIKNWLLSSFAVNTLLHEAGGLTGRVIYEDIPSGNDHLLQVLKAMHSGRILRLDYQDYFDQKPRMVVMKPYLVRVFRKRWYVVGPLVNKPRTEEPTELTNQGIIRRYALDRVGHLEVTDKKFKMPQNFDAEEYFSTAFGIIVEPEEYRVETIRVKAYDVNHRPDYLRSLPLHPSQRETERGEGYSVFEVRLAPTYDFIQELLSMGGEVEVLSPPLVRQEMKRRALDLYQRY